jgi:SAM-dependent methyltransferase
MTEEIDYQDYQKALQFDQRVTRMGPLQSLVDQILEQAQPQKGQRILDVGTGTGRLGMALQSQLPDGSVVGLDSGRGMLRVAREKIAHQHVDNFFLVRGVAESLPFSVSVFDTACMMLSFHHFADPQRALRELQGALRPGGYLVSLDPVLLEPEEELDRKLNESIEEAFQEAHGPDFKFFTQSQLQTLYLDAGFSIGATRPHEFAFDNQSIETVPMGPHWLQARENLWFRRQKDLLRKFEEKYFKFETTSSGLLVSGKTSWVIFRAEKPLASKS